MTVVIKRAGNAGRHRGEIRRAGDRDIGERVHHAPDRAEQAEKRRAAHRRREQDHLRFQPERGLADRAFHRGVDRAHLRRRNLVRDLEPRPKGFVHFRGTEQLEGHLLAAGAINIEERRAGKARVAFEEAQRLAILPEGRRGNARSVFGRNCTTRSFVIMTDQLKIEPTQQKAEDDLAGDGRVLEREKQTAGRENLQREHGRQLPRVDTRVSQRNGKRRVVERWSNRGARSLHHSQLRSLPRIDRSHLRGDDEGNPERDRERTRKTGRA